MATVAQLRREARLRRHRRVRKKIAGTPERPRLCVFRSARHIYAQLIDDVAGVTLAAASTVEADVRETVERMLGNSWRRSAMKTQGWRRRLLSFAFLMEMEAQKRECHPCQRQWRNVTRRLQAFRAFRLKP